MLVDFMVENFRSIKEPVLLSAVAQKSKGVASANGERRIVPDNEIAQPFEDAHWGIELLPVLGIFGANASGKSNVLFAFNTLCIHMTGTIVYSANVDNNIFPFMLDHERRNSPTKFQIRIIAQGNIYTYVLHIDREHILYESIHYAPSSTKKDRLLYLRLWDTKKNDYIWKNGEHFSGAHTQLESSLSERETLLSLLSRLEIPILAPLKHWLKYKVFGIGHGYEHIDEWGAARTAYEKPEHLKRVSAIVRLFDTGIVRFEIVKKKSEEEQDAYEIWAWHTIEKGEVRFPIYRESAGTRRLFGLADNLLKTLDEGTLSLVDELGSSIHPNITRAIVRMFQNPKTNPKRAQLIFTSHDNTLQRNHLLRRDQIWFTQKRPDGSTELFPLSDFKPRNDSVIDKSYLDGRFGAVPILPDEDELALITAGER